VSSDPQHMPISFSTFVISLAQSAMVHLGETPDPSGQTQKNLALARQTIDLIGVLEAKTKGNLDDDEAKLISSVLTDLRTRFVAVSQNA